MTKFARVNVDFLCALSAAKSGNYLLGIEHGVWGVTEAYERVIGQVRAGDRVFFVVDGVLRAAHSVESEMFKSHEKIWPAHDGDSYSGSHYPYRIRISRQALFTSFARMSDLADQLKLTATLKQWGGTIQGANGVFRKLTPGDAQILEKAMRGRSLDDLING